MLVPVIRCLYVPGLQWQKPEIHLPRRLHAFRQACRGMGQGVLTLMLPRPPARPARVATSSHMACNIHPQGPAPGHPDTPAFPIHMHLAAEESWAGKGRGSLHHYLLVARLGACHMFAHVGACMHAPVDRWCIPSRRGTAPHCTVPPAAPCSPRGCSPHR